MILTIEIRELDLLGLSKFSFYVMSPSLYYVIFFLPSLSRRFEFSFFYFFFSMLDGSLTHLLYLLRNNRCSISTVSPILRTVIDLVSCSLTSSRLYPILFIHVIIYHVKTTTSIYIKLPTKMDYVITVIFFSRRNEGQEYFL